MAVNMDHVTLKFGSLDVLQNFCLTLPETGIMGITGPSGCGKSTLLHILAGLLQPDAGKIEGLKRDRIGIVFQEDRLLPWMTAFENLNLVLQNKALALTWLKHMDLDQQAEQYPAELSGGMKRRIALARALAYDCDLLLLDEPFQGLDEVLKERIYPLIRRIAEDKPIILVSHDRTEITQLADQVFQAIGPPLSLHCRLSDSTVSDSIAEQ